MSSIRQQRTICRPVSVSGFGYWSGKDVRVQFRPAPVGSGITLVRDDLGPNARVPAQVDYREDVPRRTNLSYRGARFEMVEHVMGALAGLHIDNCEVGVDQAELPGCDGSALDFVEALDSAGLVEQEDPASLLEITETVRLTLGDTWIEAHPNSSGSCSLEYELDYPHDLVIGHQTVAVMNTPAEFRQQIAPCRTFVLQGEADEMVSRGLASRVTTRDLLVFGEEGPVGNRLRFSNECARHKVLDLIGDLALTGCQIAGHIVAYRSGHQLNAALSGELKARFAIVFPLKASA